MRLQLGDRLRMIAIARKEPTRYQKKLAARRIRPCDLCDDPGGSVKPGTNVPARFQGSHWHIIGHVCKQCRDELVAEKAEKTKANRCKHRTSPECNSVVTALEVLNGRFIMEDMTPEAMSRVIRQIAKKPVKSKADLAVLFAA